MNTACLPLLIAANKAETAWAAKDPYSDWKDALDALEAVQSPAEIKFGRTVRELKDHVKEEYLPAVIQDNKGRFLFRNLRKNGSNLEREILKFVKRTIRDYDAWGSFADGIEDFSLGFIGDDFTGVVEIPLDKVRRFRVKEIQDYELEVIGAHLRGAEIREEFDISDYDADTLFAHLDEEKFKALYSSKGDGCAHDCIAEMEPDEVQESLNEMVGKPVKIFDQGRCGICLEEVRLFALSCGCAVFCQGCVGPYVKSSQKKCPICRKSFTLAKCCQPAEEYEFTEEGLEALLEAEDDCGIMECLDFTSLALGLTDTDELIEQARDSYLNYEEVEPEQAREDNDAGFTNCGEEFATCGYYLCFEEIGDE